MTVCTDGGFVASVSTELDEVSEFVKESPGGEEPSCNSLFLKGRVECFEPFRGFFHSLSVERMPS